MLPSIRVNEDKRFSWVSVRCFASYNLGSIINVWLRQFFLHKMPVVIRKVILLLTHSLAHQRYLQKVTKTLNQSQQFLRLWHSSSPIPFSPCLLIPLFYLFEYLFQKYWFNSRSRKVIGRRKGKTKKKHTKVVLDRILARIHWHVSGPTDVGLIWERELWERRGWLCGFILLVRRGTKWPL